MANSFLTAAEWQEVVTELQDLPLRFRLKLWSWAEPSVWDNCFVQGIPDSYLELPHVGPVRITELEWLEIDTLERQHIGRLIPDKFVDHSTEVTNFLQELNVPFEVMGEVIRINSTRLPQADEIQAPSL